MVVAKPQLPILLLLLLLFLTASAAAEGNGNISAVVVAITKDETTGLFTIPFAGEEYLLDITANYFSNLCKPNHPTVACNSTVCSAAHAFCASFCPATTVTADCQSRGAVCSTSISNTLEGSCFYGEPSLVNAGIVVSAIDRGYRYGNGNRELISLPQFTSVCGYQTMLGMLPESAVGIAGLSISPLSLPSQFSDFLSIERKFAVCLPSTGSAPGVAFFGAEPPVILETGEDLTSRFSYTELKMSPRNSAAYYIGIDGISINHNPVDFTPGVFEFDAVGNGGVMLSTATPYTTMLTEVYMSFLKAYNEATAAIPRAKNVIPFDLCLNTTSLKSDEFGYDVPPVDLKLSDGKTWTLYGANTFKQVAPDVICLAFVDGGPMEQMLTYNAVIVGGFQLEESLLVFDMDGLRLGYISSLPGNLSASCEDFDFESQPSNARMMTI